MVDAVSLCARACETGGEMLAEMRVGIGRVYGAREIDRVATRVHRIYFGNLFTGEKKRVFIFGFAAYTNRQKNVGPCGVCYCCM